MGQDGWVDDGREEGMYDKKVVDGFIYMLEERWWARQEAGADVIASHSPTGTPTVWLNAFLLFVSIVSIQVIASLFTAWSE